MIQVGSTGEHTDHSNATTRELAEHTQTCTQNKKYTYQTSHHNTIQHQSGEQCTWKLGECQQSNLVNYSIAKLVIMK